MRTGRILASAVGLALLMSASEAAAQKRGGDLVVAITQAPPSLDAQVTSAQVARDVTLHIFETLYSRDENAKAVPDLAEGVTISPDGKSYVFPLRHGVKFHNGKELDSGDVVASIERYRKIGASASLLAAIDTVKATGPYEVTITLKSVQSTFLENLSSPRAPIAIYPAAEAAKPANQIEYIGTGPFRFVEYKPDSYVKLARFDGYVPNPKATGRDGFAGKKEVFLDTVTFRFMPEEGARDAALQAGDVQLVETVDGTAAKRLGADPRFVLYKVLPFAFQVIKFNHARPPGNDVNFRLAVAQALDMEQIMAIAFPDIYQMDGAWLYPKAPFYGNAGIAGYNKPNPAAAKALLAKSSYKGEKLTFIIDNLRADVDTATMVQEQLKDIGINVELSVADWPTVSRIGFTPTGWNFWAHGFGIEPYEGPASVMAPWVGGTSQQVKDPVIDTLYTQLNGEMDEGKRHQLFDAFQTHMAETAVALKAGNYGLFQMASAKLKNFVPYRIPRFWGVWLEP